MKIEIPHNAYQKFNNNLKETLVNEIIKMLKDYKLNIINIYYTRDIYNLELFEKYISQIYKKLDKLRKRTGYRVFLHTYYFYPYSSIGALQSYYDYVSVVTLPSGGGLVEFSHYIGEIGLSRTPFEETPNDPKVSEVRKKIEDFINLLILL